jgi:hypothetical protein
VKVIGFLDFLGNWDPSLAFVNLIGPICVFFVAYRLTGGMSSPLLAAKFSVPNRTDLDGRLILGAVIFDAGWGLGGFLPGTCDHVISFRSYPRRYPRRSDVYRNLLSCVDGTVKSLTFESHDDRS